MVHLRSHLAHSLSMTLRNGTLISSDHNTHMISEVGVVVERTPCMAARRQVLSAGSRPRRRSARPSHQPPSAVSGLSTSAKASHAPPRSGTPPWWGRLRSERTGRQLESEANALPSPSSVRANPSAALEDAPRGAHMLHSRHASQKRVS